MKYLLAILLPVISTTIDAVEIYIKGDDIRSISVNSLRPGDKLPNDLIKSAERSEEIKISDADCFRLLQEYVEKEHGIKDKRWQPARPKALDWDQNPIAHIYTLREDTTEVEIQESHDSRIISITYNKTFLNSEYEDVKGLVKQTFAIDEKQWTRIRGNAYDLYVLTHDKKIIPPTDRKLNHQLFHLHNNIKRIGWNTLSLSNNASDQIHRVRMTMNRRDNAPYLMASLVSYKGLSARVEHYTSMCLDLYSDEIENLIKKGNGLSL